MLSCTAVQLWVPHCEERHEPHPPGGTRVDVGLAVSQRNRGPRLRGAVRSRTLQEGPLLVQLLVVDGIGEDKSKRVCDFP